MILIVAIIAVFAIAFSYTEQVRDMEEICRLKDRIEKLEKIERDHKEENGRLRKTIKQAEDHYIKALDKANNNGTYIDKVAVSMFNILEGNRNE